MTPRRKQIVGIISDTHGLLRPEVRKAFKGVDVILHAGDIGASEVLAELRTMAPVIAIRGNNDKESWAKRIPETTIAEIGPAHIYMVHDLNELNIDPGALGVGVVVSGHSHKPSIERRDGILFINPGSAGPRRFKLPVTVSRLEIDGGSLKAKTVELWTAPATTTEKE